MRPAPPPTTSATATAVVRVGAVAGLVAVGLLTAMDVQAIAGGVVEPGSVPGRLLAIAALRAAFLVVAVGTLAALPGASGAWRWVVRGAAAMLACSVGGELYGTLADAGLLPDIAARLGAVDTVERRLFRLAAMAARAVPLLALLAASEVAVPSQVPAAGNGRWLPLLLKYEPVLFTIGATTLATILAASAFVHREIAWALPIGADTTVAGCVAAAVRASRRHDRLSLVAWVAVCSSMVVGLLMGIYAFGGPLPAPAAIGDYGTLIRTSLRDAHIVVLALGLLALALRPRLQPGAPP